MTRLGRYSFLVFALIALAGLVMGIQALIAPHTFLGLVQTASGADLAGLIARDADAARGLSLYARWTGTQFLGLDGLTLILALTTYRRGDRLTWWLMWYWPAMFASHALLYRPATGLWYMQFVNLALTLFAQVASASVRRPEQRHAAPAMSSSTA